VIDIDSLYVDGRSRDFAQYKSKFDMSENDKCGNLVLWARCPKQVSLHSQIDIAN